MDKVYEPKKYESDILKKWNDAKAFLPVLPEKSRTGKSYTIPIPPPNVTGTLHLGHAMMVVVEDIMARYHRMKGDATLWLPGTDHAAIATESVVLKNLGVSSREIFTREEFMEKCFDHTKKSQATITNQVKKMGASCDFTRERYTMDLGMSNAVWKIFKDLYEAGLVVRGYRMVNWSPKAQSVLADDELESEDRKEAFSYIKCGRFVIGTVRSETKCADSPVIIHPDENYVVARFTPSFSSDQGMDDKRSQSQEFVFSEVLFDDEERRNKIFNLLPEGTWEKISVHAGSFFEGESFESETYAGVRKFFVMTDSEVIDIHKGTGAMTISVNHAPDDYLLAQKYPEKLKEYYIEKVGFDGKMTSIAGELAGVEVEIARKRAIKIMQTQNLLVGLDKEYVHNVPLCYRTGCVVEPMISPQWFIDVNKEFDWIEGVGAVKNENNGPVIKTTLKELTLSAVKNGEVKIIPERFNKIYYQWIENLRDWCISRQIWWGHQIPVWYDQNGNQFLAEEQNLLFARHGESEDNIKDIIGGDSSLTEKGRQQAKELAEKLISENRKIVKLYCSSLKRSKETAEIIAEKLRMANSELQVEEFPDFHELYTGDLENTPRDHSYPSTFHKMRAMQTGETLEEIEARAKKFWEEISKREKENGDILLIGHRTFLSMIFAVKDGRFGETLLDYRDRWVMKNGDLREVCWMMKPKINYELPIANYDEYLKNIEELLKTEKTEKYDRTQFWTIGKISEAMQKILSLDSKEFIISEFTYAKLRGWLNNQSEHSELLPEEFYLLPHFLANAVDSYESVIQDERYLIFHGKEEHQGAIIIFDTINGKNELVSYFFVNNLNRYLESLEKNEIYTKKESLKVPASVTSCIATSLREDLNKLVAEIFANRQTLSHLDIIKFFEELQKKSAKQMQHLSPLQQDQDTLDTWFSSALWPFSTLGWPDKTPDFENFYPTSILETGHDILFFWVARMIMFGKFATGKNPFKDVYLHGLVCDEHGKKMSKSKGNGIDPLEMIEKFGTDALRMALVVGTTPGNQVNLGEKKIEGYRNFSNKLWNISRYIMQLPIANYELQISSEGSLPERWILSKLQTLITEITEGLENHKYGEVGQKLYDFTWNDLADWAIESAKAVESETIGSTLRFVLENLLKLLHPYMPFITEQIWKEMQSITNNELQMTNLLMTETFPTVNTALQNQKAEELFEILQSVISSIRSLRSASKVDPVKKIRAVLNTKDEDFLKQNENIVKLLARLENLEFGEKPEEECVVDVVSGIEIYLPLSGMLDTELEKARKAKELEDAKKQLETLEGRLANEKYMASAPAHLVAQTKAQHAEILEKIKMLSV